MNKVKTDTEDGVEQNAAKKPRKDDSTEKLSLSAEVKTDADGVILATQLTSTETVSTGVSVLTCSGYLNIFLLLMLAVWCFC